MASTAHPTAHLHVWHCLLVIIIRTHRRSFCSNCRKLDFHATYLVLADITSYTAFRRPHRSIASVADGPGAVAAPRRPRIMILNTVLSPIPNLERLPREAERKKSPIRISQPQRNSRDGLVARLPTRRSRQIHAAWLWWAFLRFQAGWAPGPTYTNTQCLHRTGQLLCLAGRQEDLL